MADSASRSGTRYTDEEIIRWVDKTHASHDEGLDAAFKSPDSDGVPAIQVGPSEGKLLELLVRMVSARKIVEVGTLAGYSAIRMAQALPDDGKLWTIEFETAHVDVARRNLATAGVSDKVEVILGAVTGAAEVYTLAQQTLADDTAPPAPASLTAVAEEVAS